MARNIEILSAICNSPNAMLWTLDFDELTWAEKVFRVVWGTIGELDNGGFDQFFFNSSGDTAGFAPEAFSAIGATQVAEIIRAANSLFPAVVPARDLKERRLQLDALDEQKRLNLQRLEKQFYDAAGGLQSQLYRFVISHKAQIRGSEGAG